MAEDKSRQDPPKPSPERERESLTAGGAWEKSGERKTPPRKPKPAPVSGNLGPMNKPPKKD